MKKALVILIVSILFVSMFSIFKLNPASVKAQDPASAYLTDVVQLTTNPFDDRGASWYPDSSKIVYSAFSDSWYRHIWVMNSDGSGKTQLTFGNVVDDSPDISPDGTKIVFMRYGLRGIDGSDLMVMNADGSNIQQLTSTGLHRGQPRWSHDGTRIAFYYGGAGTTTNEIHIMNADGTNEVTVASGTYPVMNPDWSPDDTKLVYTMNDGIYTVSTSPPYQTSRLYQTPLPTMYAVYSPDGKYIMYASGPYGTPPPYGQNLYLIDTSGNFIAQLTSDNNFGYQFDWSPNGQYIAYDSLSSGNYDVWRANIVGLTTWKKNPSNPVLDIGSSGSWDDLSVWAPTVIWKDNSYWMWYCGGRNDQNIRIGLATSSDGVSWTRYGTSPVLDVSPSGWDSLQVNSPSVVFNGSKYCMWYSGDNGYGVGLATSSDGVSWTKYPGNPVFSGGRYVSVIFDGSTYRMWYEGYDYTIRYATSSDGISWTEYSGNPVLTPGPSGSWDGMYVSAPSVVFDGSQYIMSYTGYRDSIFSRKIGIAYSQDGITWSKDPSNPVIDVGIAGAWDGTFVDHSSMLLVGSSLKMWYSGFDGTNSVSSPTYYNRIGLACATGTQEPVPTYSVTLTADSHGSISYSYSGGSSTVSSGHSQQLTIPQGGQVSLTANPDSPTNSFQSWSTTGSVSVSSPSSASTTATIEGNSEVKANFWPLSLWGYDWTNETHEDNDYSQVSLSGSQLIMNMPGGKALQNKIYSNQTFDGRDTIIKVNFKIVNPQQEPNYAIFLYSQSSGHQELDWEYGSEGQQLTFYYNYPQEAGISFALPIPWYDIKTYSQWTTLEFDLEQEEVFVCLSNSNYNDRFGPFAGFSASDFHIYFETTMGIRGYWTATQSSGLVVDSVSAAAVQGTQVKLSENQRHLYLHVYDSLGNHVGINYTTNEVDLNIPGSYYGDNGNGTTVIVVPQVMNLTIVVDARFAENPIESYNLTVTSENDIGSSVQSYLGTIAQGIADTYHLYVPPNETPIIDDSPPSTKLTIVNPMYIGQAGTYVTSNTSFTLLADDGTGSGVAETAYRVINSTYDAGWILYSTPFKLNSLSDGSYTLFYNSTDNAGNVEQSNTATIAIDNMPPSTSLAIGDPKYPTAGSTLATPGTSFTLSATDDSGSGVAAIYYIIWNATYSTGKLTYTKPFYLTTLTNGNYTISYYSIDNLGNKETQHSSNITLFSWTYVFKDSYGRGTVLQICTQYELFQFTAPNKDFGIKYDRGIIVLKNTIVMCFNDKTMSLVALGDGKTGACAVVTLDKQTSTVYLLVSKPNPTGIHP